MSLLENELCQLIDICISGNDDWEGILVALDETGEFIFAVVGHRARVWRKLAPFRSVNLESLNLARDA